MKKKWIIFITIIICVAIIASLIFLNRKKDYLFISDNDIYFNMFSLNFKIKMGKAKSVEKNICDTNQNEYSYKEKIGGFDADCSYIFLNQLLIEMDCVIDNIDYDSALSLVKNIMKKQSDYYEGNEHYFENNIIKTANNGFRIENGLHYGATGIDYSYEYENGKLSINACDQY